MRKRFLGTVLAVLIGLGMAFGGFAASGYTAISWQVRAVAAAMGLAGAAAAAPTVFYQGRNRDGSPVQFAHTQEGETWFSDKNGTRGPYPRRPRRS
jgi:hypothetical protein